MPMRRYSSMRSATVSRSPTSAVPAPPRTRPAPAQRFGLTSGGRAGRRAQARHAVLADRIHAREGSLRRSDRIVAQVLDQLVGSLHASSFVSRTMTWRQNAERDRSGRARAASRTPLDFLGDIGRRLTPGEVLAGCSLPQRRARHPMIHQSRAAGKATGSAVRQAGVFNLDMRALVVDRLAGENGAVNVEEFAREIVALLVADEQPIAAVLDWVPARDDVIRRRPFEIRSSVAVMRAATVGDCRPGRTATRNFSFSVSGAREEATIQLSSQLRPVGSSAP